MTVLGDANAIYLKVGQLGGGAASKVYAGPTQAWPVVPTGYSGAILTTSGLVAYWRLGEASGVTAVAAAGGVDATHVNSPTLGVAGATTDGNTAVTYNGTTQYTRTILLRGLIGIERPEPMAGTIQDVGDNVTMEAWVNRNGAAPGGWRGIVSKGNGAYYVRMDGGTGQIVLVKSRVAAIVAAVLGSLALLLACVGMAGVFGYVVQQRTHEIGVRMALGARHMDVIRLVVRSGLLAIGAAAAAGVFGAFLSSAWLRRYLLGLSPIDPLAHASVLIVLATAGLAATFVPARKAARIAPVDALRNE